MMAAADVRQLWYNTDPYVAQGIWHRHVQRLRSLLQDQRQTQVRKGWTRRQGRNVNAQFLVK
jgi:hypothetical protein